MLRVQSVQRVPSFFVDYSVDARAVSELLRYMPTRKVKEPLVGGRRLKLIYVNVATYDLWFVLAILRSVLGEPVFNSSVGVRLWAPSEYQVGVIPLSRAQRDSALREISRIIELAERSDIHPALKPSCKAEGLAKQCAGYFLEMCPLRDR